jgi:hypothetical protein
VTRLRKSAQVFVATETAREGAYRDPHAARAALDELVKAQGWTSAAARVAADPGQLGELRGKEGLFVGASAPAEREAAQRVAGAIAPSLTRIGAAEARVEGAYRASVEGQRAADATAVPRLSARRRRGGDRRHAGDPGCWRPRRGVAGGTAGGPGVG